MLYKLAAFKDTSRASTLDAAGMDFSRPVDDQEEGDDKFDPRKEISRFQSFCESCSAEGECRMCVAAIPYFAEIIIMAFSCEVCGHRSAEVK